MSAIGPDLPPHLLAKRKRQQEEEAENAPSEAPGAKRASTPDESSDKRRRIIGPAPPPASVEEMPTEPPVTQNEESSDDDDDFGPALPTGGAISQALNEDEEDEIDARQEAAAPPAEAKLKRDDWMTMPPTQDDLAARLDPTKQRPKAFNTGKGARGPSGRGGEDSSTWHETPEQKRKRLEREMMGAAKPSTSGRLEGSKGVEDNAAHRRIQYQAEKTRGPSLLEQHQATKGKDAEEDDPSKRAFDREKDMGSGARISSSQKRDMLNKAAGFSSKFSGGSYL